MKMGRFDNQVALVTGGGTGIGKAVSILLAKEGADVIINYSKSESEARETVNEIETIGRRSEAIKADISDDKSVRCLVERIDEKYKKLDILINNSGVTRAIPYEDLDNVTKEDWDFIFGINVVGTFQCSRAAMKIMKKYGSGHIINISSTAGYVGRGSSIPYAVSKAAIINLTKAMALVGAPQVRVNGIAPGTVMTRWIKQLDEELTTKRVQNTPMKRLATAEDIAASIFALLVSSYVTGRTLIVDGGYTIG
jgi:3-oxoacyl-[acyl-carrier protein] reductase